VPKGRGGGKKLNEKENYKNYWNTFPDIRSSIISLPKSKSGAATFANQITPRRNSNAEQRDGLTFAAFSKSFSRFPAAILISAQKIRFVPLAIVFVFFFFLFQLPCLGALVDLFP